MVRTYGKKKTSSTRKGQASSISQGGGIASGAARSKESGGGGGAALGEDSEEKARDKSSTAKATVPNQIFKLLNQPRQRRLQRPNVPRQRRLQRPQEKMLEGGAKLLLQRNQKGVKRKSTYRRKALMIMMLPLP